MKNKQEKKRKKIQKNIYNDVILKNKGKNK